MRTTGILICLLLFCSARVFAEEQPTVPPVDRTGLMGWWSSSDDLSSKYFENVSIQLSEEGHYFYAVKGERFGSRGALEYLAEEKGWELIPQEPRKGLYHIVFSDGKLLKVRFSGDHRTMHVIDGDAELSLSKRDFSQSERREQLAIAQLERIDAAIEVRNGHAVYVEWTGDSERDDSESTLSDSHLKLLNDLPHLVVLRIANPGITDEGMGHLRSMDQLEDLTITIVPQKPSVITDKGVRHLRSLKNLKVLGLSGTAMTDAGITHLENLTNLQDLDLYGTNISAKGLPRLARLVRLTYLDISHVQHRLGRRVIPAKAIEELQLLLPKCNIAR